MSQQRYYFNLLCHSSTPGEGRGAGEGLAERRVAGPPVLTATVSLEKSLCNLISLQVKSQKGLAIENSHNASSLQLSHSVFNNTV